MSTILFAHASLPPDLRTRYEMAAPGWRLVPFVAPTVLGPDGKPLMSGAYKALATSLLRHHSGSLLDGLLQHLKVEEAGPIVFAWFSAGYKLAELLSEDLPSWQRIHGWVGIDGMHTTRDTDKTANDDGVRWLVQLAQGALTGHTILALGHSDVKTYGTTASTTEVAEEVRRLSNMPDGAGPHGGLLLRPYDLETRDHDEHIAALRQWGPQLLGEAVRLLPRSTGGVSSVLWLHEGSEGGVVRELQRRLTAAGHPLKDDGVFGPRTKKAVVAFQTAAQIPANGVVDDKTWAALPPDGGGTTLGVDVSEHQDPDHTNWKALYEADVRFAILRATMGRSGLDKHFRAHLKKARATPIPVLGAYHLYRREWGWADQVEHFLSTIGDEDLVPAVDVEWLDDEGKNGKPLPAATTKSVAEGVPLFVREVEQRLRRPCLVYVAPGYAIQIPWPAELGRSPWWACHYRVAAPTIVRPWKDWLIHQKSGGLKTGGELLAGMEIDQNVFRGSTTQLQVALAHRAA